MNQNLSNRIISEKTMRLPFSAHQAHDLRVVSMRGQDYTSQLHTIQNTIGNTIFDIAALPAGYYCWYLKNRDVQGAFVVQR
jgi:hypothetical protein